MKPPESTFDASLVRASSPVPLAVEIPGVRTDVDVVASYLASLPSPRSRQTMIESLGRVAVVLGVQGATDQERIAGVRWCSLHYAATSYARSRLLAARGPDGETYSRSTVRLALAAIRGVLGTAAKLGILTFDELKRATGWPKLRGFRLPAGRALDDPEVEAVLGWCSAQPEPFGIYARAVLAILFRGGLRREELCELPLAAYEDASSLRVVGKGSKERLVPLPAGARADVEAWLALRERLGVTARSMFVRVYRDGRARRQPLSPAVVWALCKSIAKDAGVRHFSPHDARRTYVSGLLDKGLDLSMVQTLAGHESPDTTSRYDRRPARKAREAIAGIAGW